MTRWFVCAVALGAAVPGAAGAQSSEVLLNEGIAAYRDLDFAAAAGLLRRALERDSVPKMAGDRRARALMYLGAAELFGDHRDRAAAAFRTLLIDAPRFRPDTLVFPPRVLTAFREALATTKAVALNVPTQHRFVPEESVLPATVAVTSAHLVTVVLEDAEERVIVTLYDGRVDDSLAIAWGGRDADGAIVPPGTYRMRALSAAAPGTALRSVAIPLTVRHRPIPELPQPPFPLEALREERTGGASLPLVLSAIGVAAVAVAPAALGDSDQKTPRLVIGGGLALAGLIELITHRRRPIPENVAHNAQLQAQHDSALAQVQRANARRARLVELEVRAGAPKRREGGSGS